MWKLEALHSGLFSVQQLKWDIFYIFIDSWLRNPTGSNRWLICTLIIASLQQYLKNFMPTRQEISISCDPASLQPSERAGLLSLDWIWHPISDIYTRAFLNITLWCTSGWFHHLLFASLCCIKFKVTPAFQVHINVYIMFFLLSNWSICQLRLITYHTNVFTCTAKGMKRSFYFHFFTHNSVLNREWWDEPNRGTLAWTVSWV